MFFSEENVSFSTFGRSFQERLVHIMLNDRAFCEQISEVLTIEFFELKYLQEFVRIIFKHKEHYSIHPSHSTIETILKTEYSEESSVNKQIHKFFETVNETQVEDSDLFYIKDKSLDFCKKQKMKEAMIKSSRLLQKSSFDEIAQIINSALKLGQDNNFGYDYLKDFEKRFEFQSRDVIPTPWDSLNKVMNGGHGRGELGVIIAPTGGSKSMQLVCMGAHALKLGFNVVYYTLELSDVVVGNRFDSRLTGIDINDLRKHKEQVLEKIQNIPGQLIIKEYPTKQASPQTLKNHLEKLRVSGFEPDLILVDYGDILKPNQNTGEVRHNLGSIFEDLRGIAKNFNSAMWVPTQTNRSGLNAAIVTMESISEAFNKCFIADFICCISSTVKDREKNEARMFVAKNRNGLDGIILPMYMRLANIDIRVFEQTEESIEDILKKASMESGKSLMEKYSNFRSLSGSNIA